MDTNVNSPIDLLSASLTTPFPLGNKDYRGYLNCKNHRKSEPNTEHTILLSNKTTETL